MGPTLNRRCEGSTHRLFGVMFAVLPIVAVGLLLRFVLITLMWSDLSGELSLLGAIATGFMSDLIYAAYAVVPLVILLAMAPQRLFGSNAGRGLMCFVFALIWWSVLFGAVAEWVFWDEFGARFNFIAVDYLVYSTEVIDNILESYAFVQIVVTVSVVALVATYLMVRTASYRRWLLSNTSTGSRYAVAAALLIAPLLAVLFHSQRDVPDFNNRYEQEIAQNGQYAFFAAFRSNELDYHTFYQTINAQDANMRLQKLIGIRSTAVIPQAGKAVHRSIHGTGTEYRPNVIQITVESLSAEFLGAFGHDGGLTPNLDKLAEEGLLFTNFYATGTRTTRGMESLTLSVPPTPGRSIVKRPDNENLFSVGTVFGDKGYDSSFFYGGHGYFDNMNYFFGHNGFAVHDRTTEPEGNIDFENAWGVSDEDLYEWVIAEADKSAAAGRHFYHFVMTTSNHRPYTYPDGRIDIPSHSGREGAVKYTDHAIGEMLAIARRKPWFGNTIFVFVGDHCAGSAGKADLTVNKYRVPLLIYAPQLISPQKVETIASQIDFAPTLFALLNWSYESDFYGRDILALATEKGRALIGNYENLGLLEDQELTILKPLKQVEAYRLDEQTGEQTLTVVDERRRLDTIAYYQTAAEAFNYTRTKKPTERGGG